MSSIDGISPSLRGLSLIAAKRARAPRKAKPASGLRAQVEDEGKRIAPIPEDERDRGLDHSGTEDSVPFRNAGTQDWFNPLFVAQLLGQVLPNPEVSKSSGAVSAYKEIARRLKLYDRIL